MTKACRYSSRLLPLIICMIFMFSTSLRASADTINSIQLLKISPQDERAVVKMEDGTMKIIKPGDAIGKSGKVIEITTNRVVTEEQTERGMETVIIRLEDGKQKVERMKKTPDTRPELYKPQ